MTSSSLRILYFSFDCILEGDEMHYVRKSTLMVMWMPQWRWIAFALSTVFCENSEERTGRKGWLLTGKGSLGMSQIKGALMAVIDNRHVSCQHFASNSKKRPILRQPRNEYSGWRQRKSTNPSDKYVLNMLEAERDPSAARWCLIPVKHPREKKILLFFLDIWWLLSVQFVADSFSWCSYIGLSLI